MKRKFKNVVILGNCKIHKSAHILPYSIIEESEIGPNAMIGPFAHIRKGCKISEGTKIGNFCEIKNSIVGKNTKISHMSYVGDCEIGDFCNIGAGTIFCNYDGIQKHKIIVGNHCFIGSNSTIIAPRKIGNNCFIAGASVLREDLKDDQFYKIQTNQKIVKNKFQIQKD